MISAPYLTHPILPSWHKLPFFYLFSQVLRHFWSLLFLHYKLFLKSLGLQSGAGLPLAQSSLTNPNGRLLKTLPGVKPLQPESWTYHFWKIKESESSLSCRWCYSKRSETSYNLPVEQACTPGGTQWCTPLFKWRDASGCRCTVASWAKLSSSPYRAEPRHVLTLNYLQI